MQLYRARMRVPESCGQIRSFDQMWRVCGVATLDLLGGAAPGLPFRNQLSELVSCFSLAVGGFFATGDRHRGEPLWYSPIHRDRVPIAFEEKKASAHLSQSPSTTTGLENHSSFVTDLVADSQRAAWSRVAVCIISSKDLSSSRVQNL